MEMNVIICWVSGSIFKERLKLLLLEYTILVIGFIFEYETGDVDCV